MKQQPLYIKPETCELEWGPCALLSGSPYGDEGIEDITVEGPFEF